MSEKRKDDRKILKSLVMVTQIGLSMLVPIFLCVGIGWLIDQQLHTQVGMLIMMLLGIAAAFRSVYGITKSFYEHDMKREHEQLKYMDDLRNYSKIHGQSDESDDDEDDEKD